MVSHSLLCDPISLVSLDDTVTWGRFFASILKTGDVVFLSGDLGAGKTTLAQAMIRPLLSIHEPIVSPTFTLVQSYTMTKPPMLKDDKSVRVERIVHTDLYRLEHAHEFVELGLHEELQESVLLLEWPERLPGDIFEDPLLLNLTAKPESQRVLEIRGSAQWNLRVQHLLTVPLGVV